MRVRLLKQKLERLRAWATATPDGRSAGMSVLLASWAFALAMNGGAAFRDGITPDGVVFFGGRLLAGALMWGIWAAMNEVIAREGTNLRRLVTLGSVLVIFTAFASQINLF